MCGSDLCAQELRFMLVNVYHIIVFITMNASRIFLTPMSILNNTSV